MANIKFKSWTDSTKRVLNGFWCATSLLADSTVKTWGACLDQSCPKTDITYKYLKEDWFIILVVLGTLTLLILLILLILFCMGKLRCRYFENNATDHFILTFRSCCLRKCFCNEEAKPGEGLELMWLWFKYCLFNNDLLINYVSIWNKNKGK